MIPTYYSVRAQNVRNKRENPDRKKHRCFLFDLRFFLSGLQALFPCRHEKEEREKAVLFIRVCPFRVNKFGYGS